MRRLALRAGGILFRSVLLDFSIALLFVTWLSLRWVHRLHDRYLVKELDALVWTNDRATEEITYYARECTKEDISTFDPQELVLPENVTAKEAYAHQLKHGFSVFPNVLSRETAAELRKYVILRNKNLTGSESLTAIGNKNRFSFYLDTREPSVAEATRELVSNAPLSAALQKILGPDPALIELTVITSTSRALDQRWHQDVVPEQGAVNYARSFSAAYTIYLPLQDTTNRMGATSTHSVCPGTHFCTNSLSNLCSEHGSQVLSDEFNWRTGDALLYNMNSWHRGGAHNDPEALDQVVLMLSFTAKPLERAESRQMGHGNTFNLQWDHWGFTWRDLAVGRFAFPWLRALRLFKPPEAVWGIDYLSISSLRMAMSDVGFQRGDLDKFISRGGIWYLPTFLHGEVNEDESWHEYFLSALLNCEVFFGKVHDVAVGAYFLLFLLLDLSSAQHRGRGRAIRRLVVSHGAACVVYLLATRHVDRSGWARDILANRRYSNAFVEEGNGYSLDAPTTFPYRGDVLIETRYGSKWLYMYNDWFLNHPGNIIFNRLVEDLKLPYESYPDSLRDATIDYIIGAVGDSWGRFLHQSTNGTWRVMSEIDIKAHIKRELHLKSRPISRQLLSEITFLISDYKYGINRGTALSKVSFSYLKEFQSNLLSLDNEIKPNGVSVRLGTSDKKNRSNSLLRTFKRVEPSTNAMREPRNTRIVYSPEPTEPLPCAWCKSGDLVEIRMDSGAWCVGMLAHVTALGNCHVGKKTVFECTRFRPFVALEENEMVGVAHDGGLVEATVVRENGNGSYDVVVDETGQPLDGVQPTSICRPE